MTKLKKYIINSTTMVAKIGNRNKSVEVPISDLSINRGLIEMINQNKNWIYFNILIIFNILTLFMIKYTILNNS